MRIEIRRASGDVITVEGEASELREVLRDIDPIFAPTTQPVQVPVLIPHPWPWEPYPSTGPWVVTGEVS